MAAPGPLRIPVELVFGVPEVPEVAEVRRLVLRPGDRLVLRLDHFPCDDEVAEIRAGLAAAVGDVPVLILAPGMDLEVISTEPGGM